MRVMRLFIDSYDNMMLNEQRYAGFCQMIARFPDVSFEDMLLVMENDFIAVFKPMHDKVYWYPEWDWRQRSVTVEAIRKIYNKYNG